VLSNEHALTLDPTSHTNLSFSTIQQCKNLYFTTPIITIVTIFIIFTLLRLYPEIRNIWHPGAGLAGTQDGMAQIRDIPGNPGRVATLDTAIIGNSSLHVMHLMQPNNRNTNHTEAEFSSVVLQSCVCSLAPFLVTA